MSKYDNGDSGKSSEAASLTRRHLLKTGAGAAAAVIAATALVRNARSSSGELNLLNWSDEFPGDVIPNFEKATGIKVNSTPFSQNEEQINKLQATGGEGFDLVQPTRDRAPQFKDLNVLAAFDTAKIKNIGAVQPSFSRCSMMTSSRISCAAIAFAHVTSRPCSAFCAEPVFGWQHDSNEAWPSALQLAANSKRV